MPDDYDVTGLSMPNAFHAIHRVPVDGEYAIRVALGGVRPAARVRSRWPCGSTSGRSQPSLHDPERAATFADDRQDFGGQTTEFKVKLTAGDHRIAVAIPRIFEGLPARYGGPNPSTRPEPAGEAIQAAGQARRPSGSLSCEKRSTRPRRSWRRFR